MEPAVPVFMKFYLFNVENPNDIVFGGKPNLTERGPYIYREYRTKHKVLEINGDKLQYDQKVQYVYDER